VWWRPRRQHGAGHAAIPSRWSLLTCRGSLNLSRAAAARGTLSSTNAAAHEPVPPSPRPVPRFRAERQGKSPCCVAVCNMGPPRPTRDTRETTTRLRRPGDAALRSLRSRCPAPACGGGSNVAMPVIHRLAHRCEIFWNESRVQPYSRSRVTVGREGIFRVSAVARLTLKRVVSQLACPLRLRIAGVRPFRRVAAMPHAIPHA